MNFFPEAMSKADYALIIAVAVIAIAILIKSLKKSHK